ncbi:MAG TPA: DUF4437 domain-containing protein [Vicinamibacterales bacterium]|nr:DUF4437 domain-containing protein [Vicinamibacterales bacterium]
MSIRLTTISMLSIAFVFSGPVPAADMNGVEVTTQTPIFIAASDLRWTELDPAGAPGVMVVDLWGDHQKGPFGALFRLPAGFAVPLHTHTHAMKVVFLSGTYIQAPEGQPEVRLAPGSYMMQPGAEYRHMTSCDASSDCVFFVESEGAFDLKLVVAPQ